MCALSIFQTSDSRCAPLAKCLNDIANQFDQCLNDFKDVVFAMSNGTKPCVNEIKTKEVSLANLYVKSAREMENCVKALSSLEESLQKCPALEQSEKKDRRSNKRKVCISSEYLLLLDSVQLYL